MTRLVTTRQELEAIAPGQSRAVVMTMGALHDGHLELMRAARERLPEGVLIATVFVNPLQFGAGEDFDRYPRTLDADLAACASVGVDVVFAPSADEVYGNPSEQVTMSAGPLGEELEGHARPGHFGGMLTVVAILLHLTRADVAIFGEKDYQQLELIRRMAASLAFPVEVIGVPTVRDPDGLALSSRNRYLSPEERAVAVAIPQRLAIARDELARGASPDEVVADCIAALDSAGLTVDYVALRSPSLGPAPSSGTARLLVAARIGSTRLIDNLPVVIGRSDG